MPAPGPELGSPRPLEREQTRQPGRLEGCGGGRQGDTRGSRARVPSSPVMSLGNRGWRPHCLHMGFMRLHCCLDKRGQVWLGPRDLVKLQGPRPACKALGQDDG